jgi:Nuclease-related domain/UvrD-like helicase C-terminal domain/AAA domain
MARLIPSFMDDHTPPGERDVFNMLAAGPETWVVLHSLDLAPWNRGLRTEIDFIVIVPDTGILCVEVKSQNAISFSEDRWLPPEIKRSPFKQASDGRHTFYRRLREIAPQLRRVPTVHCCIFPNAIFDVPPNLSVQPWDLMDVRTFRSFIRAADFCVDIRARMLSSIKAEEMLKQLTSPLSKAEVELVVTSCLPVQKFRPSAREEIQRRQQEIERLLRDQQKPVLQIAAMNRRVIVSGAAGTGKTLIAMEVARRVAQSGRRVALLCFNRLVGDWMSRHVENNCAPLPNLIAGRTIRILAEMTGVQIPKSPTTQFWTQELPEIIEERLTDPGFASVAAFDYLVVDEAQDLLARPRLWECVTRFLEGGVANGSFCLFGDFDNQIISDHDAMEKSLSTVQSIASPTRYHLSENCRNYQIVGDSAVLLSGFDKPVYSGYMRVGGGMQNYDIFFYEDEREQLEKLKLWIKEFRSQGYAASDITILSFRSSEKCAAAKLEKSGFNLQPVWRSSIGSPSFTSVQAFKGLENKVIILTDVALGDADFHRHLFYTGMTRASESVRVLCDKNSQKTLIGWFTEKVTHE